VKLHSLSDIRRVLPSLDLVTLMANAFVAYSEDRARVAPVVELLLDGGDVHVKSGYLVGGEYYVVKVASGFYGNPALGLSSSNGLMLLFRQRTGELAAALFDEGHLTDIRTAAAGAVAAQYLAPPEVRRIAVFGTGIQAREQLAQLRSVTACRQLSVWGRGREQLASYAEAAQELGFTVETSRDGAAVAASADLIVTTTPATEPLFPASVVQPGTHVTAVGSDTPLKQELDPQLLARADVLVADSIAQCRERGEIFRALAAGAINEGEVLELGDVISGRAPGRTTPGQISVADLTGVAAQDIEIARSVHEVLEG